MKFKILKDSKDPTLKVVTIELWNIIERGILVLFSPLDPESLGDLLATNALVAWSPVVSLTIWMVNPSDCSFNNSWIVASSMVKLNESTNCYTLNEQDWHYFKRVQAP